MCSIVNKSKISYRRIHDEDSVWIENFITHHWGSAEVISHNSIYYPAELEGFIALNGDEKVGLITYSIKDFKCEIVTLNSIFENHGIGTYLMRLVEKAAGEYGCKEVWLITTNDNLRAIGFYQKIGYQLTEVFPNAVEQSRIIKPEIPLFGKNGIQIRDELKFVLNLDKK